jgi:hypothetical protein
MTVDTRGRASCRLVYEDIEPLVRLERTASALRGRRSGQVSYRGMAPGAGVEPASPGSGPGILPLNDAGKVRKVRFERTCREV